MSARDSIIEILPLSTLRHEHHGKRGVHVTTAEVAGDMADGRPPYTRAFSGRRKVSDEVAKGQEQHQLGYEGEEDGMNRLGQMYMKVLNFNVITRNAVYIVPVAACLLYPLPSSPRPRRMRGLELCVWLDCSSGWRSSGTSVLCHGQLPCRTGSP